MEYVGLKWFKCDFHLHTTKSDCFFDKSVSDEEWIQKVIEKKLQCIAITDHNGYDGIDNIKKIGEEKGLVVLPGVEVSCGDAKIHMLVIFDEKKEGKHVSDFLSSVGIDPDKVGDSKWTTKVKVKEVCDIAHEKGAIVIASHIDEYSGLCEISNSDLEELINCGSVDAVQVVNDDIWEMKVDDNTKLMRINEKYLKEDNEEITIELMKKWEKCYKKLKDKKVVMFKFSDNPNKEGDSRHGLWGIGNNYT